MQSVGEVRELGEQLAAREPERRKAALRKVVGLMATGREVETVFLAVVGCLALSDVDARKLAYLYIGQHARDRPQEAVMAVNFFIRDAKDKANTELRVAALRAMGRLPAAELCDCLVVPLDNGLTDGDARVRVAAATSIARLVEASPAAATAAGLPTLLCQALAKERSPIALPRMLRSVRSALPGPFDAELVTRLLDCLCEGNEWAQVAVIQLIADAGVAESERERVVEALISRFSHISPAVVLASAQLALDLAEPLGGEIILGLRRRVGASLSALATAPSAEAWAGMRSLRLLAAAHPGFFPTPRAFALRVADPVYVKLEKLALIEAVAPTAVEAAVGELAEAALETSREVAVAAMQGLRRLGAGLAGAVEACLSAIERLLPLGLESGAGGHILEGCILCLADLQRRNPGNRRVGDTSAMAKSHFTRLSTMASKVAFLQLLPNLGPPDASWQSVATQIVDGFHTMEEELQLAGLSFLFRAYLLDVEKFQSDVARLLESAAGSVTAPDVRDRLFFYWQLLDHSRDLAAKALALPRSPPPTERQTPPPVALSRKLGSLAATMHDTRVMCWPVEHTSRNRDADEVRLTEEDPLGIFTSAASSPSRGKHRPIPAGDPTNLLDDAHAHSSKPAALDVLDLDLLTPAVARLPQG